jgi:hypothetical protein
LGARRLIIACSGEKDWTLCDFGGRPARACLSLPVSLASPTLLVAEEPRLKTLHDLLGQAVELPTQTTKLVEEITNRLQRSIFIHNDWSAAILRQKPDRRRTPRAAR